MSIIDNVMSRDGNFLNPVIEQLHEFLFKIKTGGGEPCKSHNVSYLK